jgi:hypothetical protein
VTRSDYSEPVSILLTLGDDSEAEAWPDYVAMGLGPEQIPDLIRMVEDEDLHWADLESLEAWAPLHAWRALGQLQAEEAVEPLIRLLGRIDRYQDDLVAEELPEVLGIIGPAGVPRLSEYLLSPVEGLYARAAAAQSLALIGLHYPEALGDCVAALTRALEDFSSQDSTLNAFVINSLIDLGAREAGLLVRNAFDAGCVDLSITGDWEDVQAELGLQEEGPAPLQEEGWLPESPLERPRPHRQDGAGLQTKQERDAARRQQERRWAERKRAKKARRKRGKRK